MAVLLEIHYPKEENSEALAENEVFLARTAAVPVQWLGPLPVNTYFAHPFA